MGYEVQWIDAGHVTRHVADDSASAIAWGERKLSSGIGVVWVSGPASTARCHLRTSKRELLRPDSQGPLSTPEWPETARPDAPIAAATERVGLPWAQAWRTPSGNVLWPRSIHGSRA